MIIFINGSFGIGKSSVAELLVPRVPHSLLYDAEEVGYMLRNIYKSIDQPEDFQDLQVWRTLVVQTAEALKKQYHRTLIMPMCIWNESYFDEIISGLNALDSDFYHVCLTASRETIVNRHKQRNDSKEVSKWINDRIEKCLIAYQSNRFEKKINTEYKTITEITDEILAHIH